LCPLPTTWKIPAKNYRIMEHIYIHLESFCRKK
jgi:hypothetical protein